jgi:hypothetical protein
MLETDPVLSVPQGLSLFIIMLVTKNVNFKFFIAD